MVGGTQASQGPKPRCYRPGHGACWEACLARCRRSRTNTWASRSPFRLSNSCRIGSPAKRGIWGVRLREWQGLQHCPILQKLAMGPHQPSSQDSLTDEAGNAFATPGQRGAPAVREADVPVPFHTRTLGQSTNSCLSLLIRRVAITPDSPSGCKD